MPKRSYSAEDKLEILKACEGGQYSLNEITKIYNVHKSTIMEWRRKFDKYGSEGLKKSTTWKKYSKGFWCKKSSKLGHTDTINLKKGWCSVWRIKVYSNGSIINLMLFC